jgi:beta-phosphoglucomutase-like phosphatase (HAD superfamily)
VLRPRIRSQADARRARGLFLDLDGTLADSLTSLKKLYFSFLADFGAQGSEDEFQALNGPPLGRVVEALKQNHSLRGELSDLVRAYTARLEDAHELAPPAEGARSAIQRCSRTRVESRSCDIFAARCGA